MTGDFITQAELDIMLKKHNLFMIGKNGGARIVYKFKNLSHLNFRGMNLSGADFTGSILQAVNLSGCNCKGTAFYGCDLTGAKLDNGFFERTDFRGADLTDASMIGVDLSKADMRGGQVRKIEKLNTPSPVESSVDLSVAFDNDQRSTDLVLKGESFEQRSSDLTLSASADDQVSRIASLVLKGESDEARVSDLDLTIAPDIWDKMVKDHHLWLSTAGAKGQQMDLSNHDLRNQKDIAQTALTMIKATQSRFDELYMVKSQMQGSDFKDSSVTKIAGQYADFRGSNLAYVDFSDSDLSFAHFESLTVKTVKGEQKIRTNLSHANFSGANLSRARFWDAILVHANFRGATLDDVDFKGADLTDAVFD